MDENKKTKEVKDIKDSEKALLRGAFYSDNLLAFVYKKAERLSVAIYMITGFISREEPLRADLRGKSLDLLKNISELDGSAGDISVSASKTLKTFFEIASTLDIAANSGMISEMNYRVIKEVILELMDIVESNFDIRSSSKTLLNPNFFSIKDIFIDEDGQGEESIKDIYKGQYYKRHKTVLYKSEKPENLGGEEGEGGVEGPLSRGGLSVDKSKNKDISSKSLTPKVKERRESILDLAKKKSNFNINDVSKMISDCSDKTLQRDLLRMVDEGILKKEGERRWSTYSLA